MILIKDFWRKSLIQIKDFLQKSWFKIKDFLDFLDYGGVGFKYNLRPRVGNINTVNVGESEGCIKYFRRLISSGVFQCKLCNEMTNAIALYKRCVNSLARQLFPFI